MFHEPNPDNPREVLRLKPEAEFLCVLTRPAEAGEGGCLAALRALLADPQFPAPDRIGGVFLRVGEEAPAEWVDDGWSEEDPLTESGPEKEDPTLDVSSRLLEELAFLLSEETEIAMSADTHALIEPGAAVTLYVASPDSMED